MNTIPLLFALISQTYNLPPGLLSALCFVESKHDASALVVNDRGSASHGICQVKLATAAFVGFRGSEKQLRDPETNITYAAKYLHHQLVRYHGDPRKAIAAYNAGTYHVNTRGLIKNRKYVGKVLVAWEENR